MKNGYQAWLIRQGYDENTINAQLYRAGRVEQYYGDLDQHFEADGLSSVVDAFVYTAEDARRNKPNPTLVPYKGAVSGNMNGYKFSVRLYRRYRLEMATLNGDESDFAEDDEDDAVETPSAYRSTINPGSASIEHPVTLEHFQIHGLAALEALITCSQYKAWPKRWHR